MNKRILLAIHSLVMNVIVSFGQTPNYRSCIPFSNNPCAGINSVYTFTLDICENDPWSLVFVDEFEGDELDLYKWRKWGDGVPRDLSFKTSKFLTKAANIQVFDGKLNILIKEENLINQPYNLWETNPPTPTNFKYTSGEIQSNDLFFYGKFEARIKLPKGKGLWPAFWLFGTPWNEIDIFEFKNSYDCFYNFDSGLNQKELRTDLHVMDSQGNVGNCAKNYTLDINNQSIDFSEGFHVFAVTFEKGTIEWYVDNILVRREFRFFYSNGGSAGCTIQKNIMYIENTNYPKIPMEITFSAGVQNNHIDSDGRLWLDEPDGSTVFPVAMEVDWVKVYQRSQCGNKEIFSNETNPYTIYSDRFNAVSGQNVNINGSFIVSQNKQMDILASNSISLNSGFEVESGGRFLAEINRSICFEGKRELSDYIKSSTSQINAPLFYPNPTQEGITINVPDYFSYYDISILDLQGKIVFLRKGNHDKEVKFDLFGVAPGTYFIRCNDNTGRSFTNKLIIQ